jgi:hypothetical protein
MRVPGFLEARRAGASVSAVSSRTAILVSEWVIGIGDFLFGLFERVVKQTRDAAQFRIK